MSIIRRNALLGAFTVLVGLMSSLGAPSVGAAIFVGVGVRIPTMSPADSEMMSPGDTR
jgi:hypothetical protein